MYKRSLLKPLLALWAAIVALRILLAPEVLGRFLTPPRFDIAFGVFAASIPVIEALILFKASQTYRLSAIPAHNAPGQGAGPFPPRGTGGAKQLIAIFALCLPLGLWTQRNEFAGIAGMAAGGAINLIWTATLANRVFLGTIHRNQAP